MEIQSQSTCDSVNRALVTIQWTEPNNTDGFDVDHYEVDVDGPADALGGVSCSPACDMVDGTTTIISNLECGTTYTVKVRAVLCSLNGTFNDAMEIFISAAASECDIEVVSGKNGIVR